MIGLPYSKIKMVCTIADKAVKEYGLLMATKIHLRIDQITALDTVEDLIQGEVGRCHRLKGDRKDQYAVDLIHPYRLVFEKIDGEDKIQIAKIMEIVDYH